jgi:hypothetical protein
MNPGLAWRTARHLTAEQWLFRARAKADALFVGVLPEVAHARVVHGASRLPTPDPAAPGLARAAKPVAALQRAVWGGTLDDVRICRFALLGETFDFGSPETVDWRGDFREGANPLRRMTLAYMGYVVPLLASGDAADFALARALLSSFERRCGGFGDGALRDVWNPYAASHRLLNLLCGLALHRAAGGAPAATDEAALLDHVRFCAAHVRARLERDIQYNHLLKNLVALSVYAAACAPAPANFACLAFGVPRSLRQCVLADGFHAERSPMYHALGLLDARTLEGCALFDGSWRAEVAATAARMGAALAVTTHPDGDVALFNDSWLGDAPPARELVGDAPPPATARLADAGYVRLGEGGDAVILDCGPCGPDDQPAHAHADFLSIEASVGGVRLIVDPGTATYTAGPLREETRFAASHNGPVLEGVEPLEFWLAFRVGRRTRASEIADAGLAGIAPLWCAGRVVFPGGRDVVLRRWVGLWPGRGMLVCDVWAGAAGRAARSRFLVPAAWSLSAKGDGALGLAHGATRLRAAALAGALDAPAIGRFWPRFGREAAAHAITLRPAEGGTMRRAALWFGWNDSAAPPDGTALAALFGRLAGR